MNKNVYFRVNILVMAERIRSYSEFYQFYLSEHQNTTSRILHFIGTFLVFVLVFQAIFYGWGWKWIFVPLVGYGFAWIGHALFEKNKPATFKYPLWSLISDFKLFFEILAGKRSFNSKKD
ncbi:Mpo1-like protein [Salegentibacter chungangensis]|uniref:Mpo1-like protein n=1 Tax=Salegentibacter chungangensis TaxID=1335724 RepID=A0ABW3NSC4_9FLAO